MQSGNGDHEPRLLRNRGAGGPGPPFEHRVLYSVRDREADGGPTILCVDDDPVHLEVVRSLPLKEILLFWLP